MLTKPWNLCILRHSALTEKSQILKEHILGDRIAWIIESCLFWIYVQINRKLTSKDIYRFYSESKHYDIRN